MNLRTVLAAFVCAFLAAGVPANWAIAADTQVKGTLTYRTYTVTFKYAWLVKGPYEYEGQTPSELTALWIANNARITQVNSYVS
jgi:hypothetical protein